MATINIAIDTSTKDVSVSVNGETVENVEYISVYKYIERSYDEPDEPHICVSLEAREKGEEKENICKSWSIRANKIEPVDVSKSVKNDFLSCLPSK